MTEQSTNTNIQCLPTEIIHTILFNLTDIDIANYCLSHINARTIWNDDIFWINKLDHDLGYSIHDKVILPSNYIVRYSGGRNTYIRWKKFTFSLKFICCDNIDIIMFKLDTHTALNSDATDQLLYFAVLNAHFELLKRLALINVFPSINEANAIAGYGALDILIWLSQYNIIPTSLGANFALLNGHSHINDWLRNQNINPNQDATKLAAMYNRLDILQDLEKQNIHANAAAADYAADLGCIPILEWLAERRILPTVNSANTAIANNCNDVLYWLEQHNIFPDQDGANYAALQCKLTLLEKLERRGILPNVTETDCAEYDRLQSIPNQERNNILSWLTEKRKATTQ